MYLFAVKRLFCVVRTSDPKRADYFVHSDPYIFLTSFTWSHLVSSRYTKTLAASLILNIATYYFYGGQKPTWIDPGHRLITVRLSYIGDLQSRRGKLRLLTSEITVVWRFCDSNCIFLQNENTSAYSANEALQDCMQISVGVEYLDAKLKLSVIDPLVVHLIICAPFY